MGNLNVKRGGGAALPMVRRCPVGYVTIDVAGVPMSTCCATSITFRHASLGELRRMCTKLHKAPGCLRGGRAPSQTRPPLNIIALPCNGYEDLHLPALGPEQRL